MSGPAWPREKFPPRTHFTIRDVAHALIEFPASLVDELVAQIVSALDERIDGNSTRWLAVEEAASYLRTTPEALRKAVQRGQVPAHQPLGPGTRYLFDRRELDLWAAQG